jgi:two-component system chemotaxis sensor kinase CheA
MNAPDPVQTFLVEAGDLISQIEEIALDLGQQPADSEAINRMFRAFHTLKGSGSMFGFDALAAFTHHVETALEKVREGIIPIDQRLLSLILAARDQIKIMLEEPGNTSVTHECERIIVELKVISAAGSTATPVAPTTKAAVEPGALATWQIHFQPAPDVAAGGLDLALLLDELRGLGRCEIVADSSGIPTFNQLNPEQCYVAWDITITTEKGINSIRDVFMFVEDESKITIEPVTTNKVTERIVTPANTVAPSFPVPPVKSASAEAKPAAPPNPSRNPALLESTVRVPSSRLDRLVNLVGELVMNQSRLAQVSARIKHADLSAPVEEIERLVAELRDTVLGIRMMPIGSTFSRFKRLVHDLSLELGKEIDLVTEGAETELDKTVLDQLGDPLVHLIRNCIDHAIGTPEERIRLGKSGRGTIRLNATHVGSHVVIAIQDDGRGLDPDLIRAKAIEKGIISANATLSPKDVLNLIFLPGFSTAKTVTSVSGRGVGMDVVKKQVDALRGSIQLSSKVGLGTTVSLMLPLTLAIIDGLLVEIGGTPFILPMSAVSENVELHGTERTQQNGRNLVAVRGELVPYIRLRELFDIRGVEPAIEMIVILNHDGNRVGLVVDSVLGSHQTVIQSLGRFYRQIEVASGATIMGDGRVALILDLAALIRAAEAGPNDQSSLMTADLGLASLTASAA